MWDMPINYRPEPMTEIHYVGDTEIIDENGFLTGEKEKSYSEPVEFYANLSAPGGAYTRNAFGSFKDYTHVLTAARELPVQEESIVFFQGKPYKVRRCSLSLNFYIYALEAVNAQDYPSPAK